jgi:hypothetical protein
MRTSYSYNNSPYRLPRYNLFHYEKSYQQKRDEQLNKRIYDFKRVMITADPVRFAYSARCDSPIRAKYAKYRNGNDRFASAIFLSYRGLFEIALVILLAFFFFWIIR